MAAKTIIDLTTQEGVVELAMQVMATHVRHHVKNGSSMPMLVLIRPDGNTDVVAVATGHPSEALTPILASHQYIAWLTVTDAWIATVETAEAAREAAGRVRDMPGRSEAIICSGKHLPSGYEFAIFQKYRREGTQIIPEGEYQPIANTNTNEGIDSSWAFGKRSH